MSIQISDPLSLLPYQTGAIESPLKEQAAKGQSELDAKQKYIIIGEPIPIVFCRRVDNVGGVFVSPGATEGRFANHSTTNLLTVNIHLVLSEGDMPQLQLRDVYQRACRVGTWAQTYDRRAGTFTPGNFITTVANTTFWNCPYYCGTSGLYTNLTTLSYLNTHADGDVSWDKQVHCFVRQGMQIERIIDEVVGSSSNMIDLALYLIRESSRFPELMLDLDAMLLAAQFTNANGLFYNGIFKESTNLEDWLQATAKNFLLRFSDKNGKKGFKPRLPIDNAYAIDVTAIDWVFAFTEEHLVPNGFEIEYIPLSERKPICAQMMWRQQPDNDIGLIRTTEVRFTDEAPDGPFEQLDLSVFCTSENHAVKVGAYYLAQRKYVTHTLRLKVKPDAFSSTLTLGDIVRVQLRRETDAADVTFHDFLYEVERINKSITGIVELDLMHFPIDSQGRSLVALNVAAAVGPGYVYTTGRVDFACDIAGRDVDTTPLPDTGGNLPDMPDSNDTSEDLTDNGPEAPPDEGNDNPEDPFEPDPPGGPGSFNGLSNPPQEGETANIVPPCPGGKICWYRVTKSLVANIDEARTAPRTLIQCQTLGNSGWESGGSLILTNDDIDHYIIAEVRCPDEGRPDGFGDVVDSGITEPVIPDIYSYQYVRWQGIVIGTSGFPVAGTTLWQAFASPTTFAIHGLWGCVGNVELSSNQSTSCPPVGAVSPWRASVSTTNITTNPTGSFALGGFYSPCFSGLQSFPPNPGIAFSGTVEGRTISVSGVWQFSNNQSTVEAEWGGFT